MINRVSEASRAQVLSNARLIALASAALAAAALAVASAPARAEATAPGQLYSFGLNTLGQLGRASNAGSEMPSPTPGAVTLPGATGAVVQISTGATHTLLVTSSGQLYSFGGNSFGQLGSEASSPTHANAVPSLVALPPSASSGVIAAAAGQSFSLVLTASGQLYSFGENQSGQLGVAANAGSENANPKPQLVALPEAAGKVTQIAAGEAFSLALSSSGRLYAFGSNSFGQLGNATNAGTSNANASPTVVTLPGQLGPITQIAAGAQHSLVLTASRQLYSFGENRYGQLGRASNSGTLTPTPTPAPVTPFTSGGAIVQLAAGLQHSLALSADGSVYSFGQNLYGQLGRPQNTGAASPNAVPAQASLLGAAGHVIKIDSNASSSFALGATGRALGFGENVDGELGIDSNVGSEAATAPAQPEFASPTSLELLSDGPTAHHTLALVADLGVLNGSLPAGQVGLAYGATALASGGVGGYSWSASGLPAGLSIDPASGQIIGTPVVSGVNNVVLRVADAFGLEALSATIALTVAPAPPPPRARISSTLTEGELQASLGKQLGMKGRLARISSLVKKRRYSYAFTALTAGTLRIDWYYLPPGAHLARARAAAARPAGAPAPVLLASGAQSFRSAGTKLITVKLTKRGRKLLRRHRRGIRLTAKGSFAASGKRAVTARKVFVLGR